MQGSGHCGKRYRLLDPFWPSNCSSCQMPPIDTPTYTMREQLQPVAVAMCTYQGARFVEAQLRSLQTQSWPTRIHVSDDASQDDTAARVSALIRPGTDELAVQPENIGYVQNFQTSIRAALDSGAQHIALSDQDDICQNNRIESGMQHMQTLQDQYGSNTPLLVHSDLRLVDAQGQQRHASFFSSRRYRITTRKNLLLILGENGVMGNTILMNRALARLCLPFPEHLHVHDYWIAVLAELFGQRVLHDTPTVDYRLHGHNASNTADSMPIARRLPQWDVTWRKLLERDFKLPFKEDSRLSVLQHLLDNESGYPTLTSEQRKTLIAFVDYLRFEQSRWRSLHYLLCSGIARSGVRYRLRLCLATLFTRRYGAHCGHANSNESTSQT